MTDVGGSKSTVDDPCESETVVKDKDVEYADIGFDSFYRLFQILFDLSAFGFIVLMIEVFIDRQSRKSKQQIFFRYFHN